MDNTKIELTITNTGKYVTNQWQVEHEGADPVYGEHDVYLTEVRGFIHDDVVCQAVNRAVEPIVRNHFWVVKEDLINLLRRALKRNEVATQDHLALLTTIERVFGEQQ